MVGAIRYLPVAYYCSLQENISKSPIEHYALRNVRMLPMRPRYYLEDLEPKETFWKKFKTFLRERERAVDSVTNFDEILPLRQIFEVIGNI